MNANAFALSARAAARGDGLLLRRGLQLDAIATGATAFALLAFATPLSAWSGLPAALLGAAGFALMAFVALLAWLMSRPRIPPRGAWAVIALNALWVVDSVALLFWPGIDATAFGAAFVLAQAAAVALFALLQWFGVRRLGAQPRQ